MASVQATERLTNRKHFADEIDERIRPLTLAAVTEALQALSHRAVRRDRLERDDRAYRWIVRKSKVEGRTFRSTYAQAAAGMGYETTGDRKEDLNRFGNNVYRALNSLEDAGLISWRGVKRANGQWWCIEITVLDNPRLRTIIMAKNPPGGRRRGHNVPARRPLTAAARRRPWRAASSAARIFFRSFEMSYPLRGVHSRSGSELLGGGSRSRDPGMELSPSSKTDARQRPGEQPAGEAAVESAISAERAALLARFEAHFGEPRFSHRRWGERLDRALARLDRYADFGAGRDGAGLEIALELVDGIARWRRGAPRPASLAYFIPLLEEISKDWRRKSASRTASAPRGWRGSWAHPKARKNGRSR